MYALCVSLFTIATMRTESLKMFCHLANDRLVVRIVGFFASHSLIVSGCFFVLPIFVVNLRLACKIFWEDTKNNILI